MLLSGLALAVIGALLFSALINLWPAVDKPAKLAKEELDIAFVWGAFSVGLTKSTGLITLALLMGAIGGYIHATTSFASYAGNRTLKWSWMWWYGLRLFIGAALGLLFYCAFRSGIFAGTANDKQIDPYGTAVLAGLAGLFSKQAIDKLEEIFDTLARVAGERGDAARGDKLEGKRPIISAIAPHRLAVGTAQKIVITGKNFADGAKVRLGRRLREAEKLSATELTVELEEVDTAHAGKLNVSVVNPGPDGETSEKYRLKIGLPE